MRVRVRVRVRVGLRVRVADEGGERRLAEPEGCGRKAAEGGKRLRAGSG